MLESLDFTYAGISCRDMGVTMVQNGNGLFEESLFASRNVTTDSIPFKEKSIFKRVDLEPLSFSLSIYLNGWQDRNNLRAIARWLFQDEFKPLTFESNTDLIYYAILTGDTQLTHNGLQEGIITLNVLCNSPYAYSDLKMDRLTVDGLVEKDYFNEGDRSLRPQLRITKIGDGDISITNQANNQRMQITGLYDNEVITINGEYEEIVSSLESSNRYIIEQHNDVWLDFEPNFFSTTMFTFEGNFECEFYYEYKYLNQDRPIYYE